VVLITERKIKKITETEIYDKRGGFGGVLSVIIQLFDSFEYSVVPGGGKCPEEEHTTCSGGPTILVTSAVYGEREKRVKKYKILFRKDNIL
jgi:hypothetical protein